ncbi:type VI secretion system baseplate subunit TssK [Pantoea agglomerans]|uniref:type VI secretion system baseplate subunit TssK n=1 Tax=Enterobacter agglomerans TaxID=549 RepID=UPI0024132E80|nr:type VI secretion system baseplate subunit TssK [Pantoea agglomerans]
MYSEEQQIYWHSGLYLQPQHFQSLDLHHAWLHACHRQQAQPYNFGIIELSMNSAALDDYVMSVDNISFILPGGDYLKYPGNCRIEKRNFRDAWKLRDRPLTLWLALRRFDASHSNVTLPEKENSHVGTRWLSMTNAPLMRDIYGNGPETEVSRILYNVRLLTSEEKEAATDCECIPLVRLCHDGEKVVCDPTFSPPAVTLCGSQSLNQLIETLVFEIGARTRKLEEYKRPEQLVSRQDRSDQLIQLMAMRSLNRVLPVLKNCMAARQVHPWSIYNLLSQLAGELSSFSDGCTCLGEWKEEGNSPLCYDHERLYDSFQRLRSTLTMLMNSLVLEDSTYIKLRNENGIYCGEIQKSHDLLKGEVLLLLRTSENVTNDSRLFNSAGFKLASVNTIDALIRHALPGVAVTACEHPPRGVPARNDYYYYCVHHDSEQWRSVAQSGAIAFYFPDMPDDLEVQLVLTGGK